MAGYLFTYFIGEEEDGEQIYFALSRDGLHWQDVNDGKPVLRTQIGTCGVRDPFLVRNPLNQKYYLMATDLRIASGCGWEAAQEKGSLDLIIWESEDLVHWSKERACTVGLKDAGCVWAPEAVYVEEMQAFLVFFASRVKVEGEAESKHRIYGTFTKDFSQFTRTFLYMEKENHIIDTTMTKEGEWYYRISKDETEKKLILERARDILGEFEPIESAVLDELTGVEGPEIYLLPDDKTWCLIADRFAEGKGYLPMVTKHLETGEFKILSPEQYDMGMTKKRHGGVLRIEDEVYERLLAMKS